MLDAWSFSLRWEKQFFSGDRISVHLGCFTVSNSIEWFRYFDLYETLCHRDNAGIICNKLEKCWKNNSNCIKIDMWKEKKQTRNCQKKLIEWDVVHLNCIEIHRFELPGCCEHHKNWNNNKSQKDYCVTFDNNGLESMRWNRIRLPIWEQ